MTTFTRTGESFITAGLLATLCAGCGSQAVPSGSSSSTTVSSSPATSSAAPTPTASGPECGIEAANTLGGVFKHLPDIKSKAVCPADVGVALAGPDATAEASEGANQTVVDDSGVPARYVASETTTFTRDVDVLLGGHRIDNGSATCSVGYQGTVSCTIGEHGFTIASMYGELK